MTTGKVNNDALLEGLTPQANPDHILACQRAAANLDVDDSLFEYAVRLAGATREWSGIRMGASPRASIALIRCARALAFIREQPFVSPDEVKSVATAVLRHRIQLSAEMEIEGIQADDVIADILNHVEAPRK